MNKKLYISLLFCMPVCIIASDKNKPAPRSYTQAEYEIFRQAVAQAAAGGVDPEKKVWGFDGRADARQRRKEDEAAKALAFWLN